MLHGLRQRFQGAVFMQVKLFAQAAAVLPYGMLPNTQHGGHFLIGEF